MMVAMMSFFKSNPCFEWLGSKLYVDAVRAGSENLDFDVEITACLREKIVAGHRATQHWMTANKFWPPHRPRLIRRERESLYSAEYSRLTRYPFLPLLFW